MGAVEDCRDLVRTSIEAAEKTEEILEEYGDDEIREAMQQVFSAVISNANDPVRKKELLFMMHQMGEKFGFPGMQKEAESQLQKWMKEHGQEVEQTDGQ